MEELDDKGEGGRAVSGRKVKRSLEPSKTFGYVSLLKWYIW